MIIHHHQHHTTKIIINLLGQEGLLSEQRRDSVAFPWQFPPWQTLVLISVPVQSVSQQSLLQPDQEPQSPQEPCKIIDQFEKQFKISKLTIAELRNISWCNRKIPSWSFHLPRCDPLVTCLVIPKNLVKISSVISSCKLNWFKTNSIMKEIYNIDLDISLDNLFYYDNL